MCLLLVLVKPQQVQKPLAELVKETPSPVKLGTAIKNLHF